MGLRINPVSDIIQFSRVKSQKDPVLNIKRFQRAVRADINIVCEFRKKMSIQQQRLTTYAHIFTDEISVGFLSKLLFHPVAVSTFHFILALSTIMLFSYYISLKSSRIKYINSLPLAPRRTEPELRFGDKLNKKFHSYSRFFQLSSAGLNWSWKNLERETFEWKRAL